MKKKVLALVLSLVMLIGIIPAAVYAAEGDPKVTLTVTPDKTTAVAGEEITFTVTMQSDYALPAMAFRTAFPAGLEYVDGSGAIDAGARTALGCDDIAWIEWSDRNGGILEDDNYVNGIASRPVAPVDGVVVCSFKATFADDAALGKYTMNLIGLDEFCDIDWNIFAEDEIAVVSTPVELVDHICSADKLTFVEAVDADCENDGNVAYYVCECGTKYVDEAMSEILQDVIVPATGHTEGEAVIENETAADCENEGSYDTVVYCSVCGEELSRETTTEEALGHTEGEAVVENNVEADCENAGSYDTVVYCSVCGEELSRETTTVEALGHTEGEVVYENVSDATCTEGGSGDAVVYCTVCGEELSRETTQVPALGHTEGEAVEENRVEATCTEEGSYDTVVYCTVCDAELSRETTTIDALGHTEGEAVEENRVEATCTEEGSYDTVVYCTVCDAELSRETTTIDALGHTEGEAVEENRVEATCTEDGSYDTVVYCSVCDAELSRETTTIPAAGHDYESVVTEPTCTEQGYTTYTCSVCGDTYVADYVDALGHDFPVKEEWVESTTEKGKFLGYCKNDCGEYQSEIRTIFVDGIDLIQDKLPLHYVRKDVAVTLKADISPVDASEEYTVTWTSSNEDVVTVDADGNVTTHKHGEAVITVTVEKEDGTTYSDTCNVKVTYTWWQWLIWFFLLGCCWYFV